MPLGIYRSVHRDVLIISNGTSHYGWHLMARGGEDDAMARGFQGWVDQGTVHHWGAYHLRNLLPPDFSWVGIFGHTPTMTAARPDDVELVCARSLGFDAAIGWGFAACFGGPSAVDVFERNGRKEELSRLIRTYEACGCTTSSRRATAGPCRSWERRGGSYPQAATALACSRRGRSAAPSSARRRGNCRAGPCLTTLAASLCGCGSRRLPALAAYGSSGNVAVADFERLSFTQAGHAAAHLSFEMTGERHPQAGVIVRLRCAGPDPQLNFPAQRISDGQHAWARLHASYPAPLDLRRHRALGLWVKGDGRGEVLNVQLHVSPQSYLHFYLPIDFTGWKYCELGEPEGDRVMDYFEYEKFALARSAAGPLQRGDAHDPQAAAGPTC